MQHNRPSRRNQLILYNIIESQFCPTLIIIAVAMRVACLFQRWFFSRSRRPSPSYEEIVSDKLDRLATYSTRYSSTAHFAHKELVYEQFLYGNSVHIVGLTRNNQDSQKWARSVMKHLNPRLLVLGGISDNHLLLWEKLLAIRSRHDHPILKGDRMVCKERIGKVLSRRMIQDQDFIWDNKQVQTTIINHRDRRIQPNDYLTVAQMAYDEDITKVALGKPSDTLVYQDLIIRYSVEQLKGILNRAVSKVLQKTPQSYAWRHADSTQAIQDYVMSQQPHIFDRELTYTSALLRQFAKVQDKILFFTPGYFVERIADQVHSTQVPPQKVYRAWLHDEASQAYGKYQQTISEGPQQIMKKFALISLLRENSIEAEFANGTNVFASTVFREFFQDMKLEELHERYLSAKEQVEGKWFELMQHRIRNMQNNDKGHQRMTLQEQLQLHSTRAIKEFPYEYEAKNYLSQHEYQVKLSQIIEKMKEILNEEDDPHQIELFDKFLQGHKSKEGIILYSKLLGKANIESYDRIKLPVFHYGAFRGVYKEYLREFLLKGERDSRRQAILKRRMGKVEAMMSADMKKLSYLSGEKGRVLQMNVSPQDGPQFKLEDVQELGKMFGEMSAEDEQEMREEFGEDWKDIQQEN